MTPELELAHSDEVLAPLEEAQEGGLGLLYRVRMLFASAWRRASSFEEQHPWIFFGGASVLVFIFILGVVSMFVADSPSEQVVQVEQPVAIQPIALEIPGAVQGIDASRLLSNPSVVQDLISPLARIQRSGYLTASTDSPVAALLVSVRAAEQLLEVDAASYLANARDREESFESYFTQLSELEHRSGVLYTELTRQHQLNLQEIGTMISKKNEAFQVLNGHLSTTGEPEAVNSALEEYATYSEQVARKQTEDGIVIDALNSSRPIIQRSQLRLAGLTANRDALLTGIRTVDIDGSGIALHQKGILTDYYSPTVQLGTVPLASSTTIGGGDRSIFPNQGAGIAFKIPAIKVLGLEEAYANPQQF